MYGYEDKTYNEVLTQAVNNIEEINQAVDAICEKGYKNLISLRQIQQFLGIMKLQQN